MKKAYIIEKNTGLREVLAAALRFNDYEVETRSEGDELLTKVMDGARPNVMLLGTTTSGLDVKMACRVLKSIYGRNLGIIVLGNGKAEERTEFSERGVDAYFRAPLNPENVVETANAFCHTERFD